MLPKVECLAEERGVRLFFSFTWYRRVGGGGAMAVAEAHGRAGDDDAAGFFFSSRDK